MEFAPEHLGDATWPPLRAMKLQARVQAWQIYLPHTNLLPLLLLDQQFSIRITGVQCGDPRVVHAHWASPHGIHTPHTMHCMQFDGLRSPSDTLRHVHGHLKAHYNHSTVAIDSHHPLWVRCELIKLQISDLI